MNEVYDLASSNDPSECGETLTIRLQSAELGLIPNTNEEVRGCRIQSSAPERRRLVAKRQTGVFLPIQCDRGTIRRA
jgi:hypothetical protein